MMWSDDVGVEARGEGRFRARIGEAWNALQGVNGGIVAAVALVAAETVVRSDGLDPADSPLRAATFGYVRGTTSGELDVEVDVVRRGRGLTTTHVRTVQDGKTTVVGRLHHATRRVGPEYHDGPAMPVRPAGTVRLHSEHAAHFSQVDTWLHPDRLPFGAAPLAEWIAWSRPWHGPTFDNAWLTMYGDYLPPAVFARNREPSRAVTVEYGIQIHAAADRWTLGDDGWLTARMVAFHSHDGFAVEDGSIWLPDGTLLATTRQTRLAG